MGGAATSTAADFYALLASAVSAATSSSSSHPTTFSNGDGTQERDLSNSGTLIPPAIQGTDRLSWISAQRERLSILLSALDKEASNLKTQENAQQAGLRSSPSMFLDGSGSDVTEAARPASSGSGLSKSRSELDFEKIEKDDEEDEDSPTPMPSLLKQGTGSWLPWSWGAKAAATPSVTAKDADTSMSGMEAQQGKSSAIDI